MEPFVLQHPSYHFVKLLGKGGVGAVYEAVKQGPEGFTKPVAIKVLHKGLVDRKAFRQSLIEQAKIVSLINHPNIVHVLELTQINTDLCVVMELVQGITLRQLLEQSPQGLDLPLALCLMMDVASALNHIHHLDLGSKQACILHNDISLQNVIIQASTFTVKLNDFGVAKVLKTNETYHPLPGSLVCNPIYAAPELLNGRPTDCRADLYSFGVLLYQMIFGLAASPPACRLSQLISLGQHGKTVDRSFLKKLPDPIEHLMSKLLAPEPQQRISSAAQVLTILDDYLTLFFQKQGASLRFYKESILKDILSQQASALSIKKQGQQTFGVLPTVHSTILPQKHRKSTALKPLRKIFFAGFLFTSGLIGVGFVRYGQNPWGLSVEYKFLDILNLLPFSKGDISQKAHLHIHITPWGQLSLEDDHGHALVPNVAIREHNLDLKPGSYTLRAEHPRLGQKQQRIQLERGQNAFVDFQF